MKSRKRVLLLGGGSIESFVLRERSQDWDIHVSSRSRDGCIRFDLLNPDTWAVFNSLSPFDLTFWVFPAEPLEAVKTFLSAHGAQLGRIVVIGSTGSYQVQEGAEVTEDSPVRMEEARVQGEEFIRSQGGIVVRAAGLYGLNRDPRQWVVKGLVGRSSKFVNFIHVEDLAQIVMAAGERGRAGAVYLAADGHPFRWDDLISKWEGDDSLKIPSEAPPSKRSSKRVNPEKTFNELQIRLKYLNVDLGIRNGLNR